MSSHAQMYLLLSNYSILSTVKRVSPQQPTEEDTKDPFWILQLSVSLRLSSFLSLMWPHHSSSRCFGNNCIFFYPSVQLSRLCCLPPWCTSSADTHGQPSGTHLCTSQPHSVCRCARVFSPAVSGDTITKVDQFVKSREVWAPRSTVLRLLRTADLKDKVVVDEQEKSIPHQPHLFTRTHEWGTENPVSGWSKPQEDGALHHVDFDKERSRLQCWLCINKSFLHL